MPARKTPQQPAPDIGTNVYVGCDPRRVPEGAPPDFFRLWTVNDVGRALRRHPQTVYRMVDACEIQAIRVGKGRGSVRFRKEDVEDYINEHTID